MLIHNLYFPPFALLPCLWGSGCVNIQIQQMYLHGADVFLQYFCGPSAVSYGLTVDHELQSENHCNKKPGYFRKHLVAAVTGMLKERTLQGLPVSLRRWRKTSTICSSVSLGLQWWWAPFEGEKSHSCSAGENCGSGESNRHQLSATTCCPMVWCVCKAWSQRTVILNMCFPAVSLAFTLTKRKEISMQ